MYYEDYEEYYEPSIADEIFDEAKEKLKEHINESIKNDIANLQQENGRLKEENKELKQFKLSLEFKERELKHKEENLEDQFKRRKLKEIFEPFEEKLEVWYADRSYKKIDKCGFCDDARKIDYISSKGDSKKLDCSCNKGHSVYTPKITEIKSLYIYKNDFWEYKFTCTPKYSSNSDNLDINIKKVIDKYNESEVNNYWYTTDAFSSEEECQKYCDWLNTKEKLNK